MSAVLRKCSAWFSGRTAADEKRSRHLTLSLLPQSATPPIGPLRDCCELAASAQLYLNGRNESNCQGNLRLRPQPQSFRFPGLSGDCSREQCRMMLHLYDLSWP